jgi:hypothetical protein
MGQRPECYDPRLREPTDRIAEELSRIGIIAFKAGLAPEIDDLVTIASHTFKVTGTATKEQYLSAVDNAGHNHDKYFKEGAYDDYRFLRVKEITQ